jgi:hypothetical protein
LNIKVLLLAGLLLVAFQTAAGGESYRHFPGAPADERTLRAQDRVEELYERGEYARALMICKEDLAPKGDKYAQYTIGFMHLAGQGVPPDNASALAWYRLAAERGDPALVRARDNLFRQMSPEKIEESNRIFADLWRDMGDSRILLRLIRSDIETLKSRTGSRIPGASSSPLAVIDVSGNGVSERYYDTIQERLKTRLKYLKSNVRIIDIDLGQHNELVRNLEAELTTEVAALDLP